MLEYTLRFVFYTLFYIFLIVNVAIADEIHQQHQAHVHGEAELLIAHDRGVLEIAFRSPGANIVGFEHSPRNAQQRQAVATATELLQRADHLFSIPAAAGCRLQEMELDLPQQHAPKGGAQDAGRNTHGEYLAHYLYHCDHPGRLDHLDVQLFKYFPATQAVEARSVSDRGQRKIELTAEHTRVVL